MALSPLVGVTDLAEWVGQDIPVSDARAAAVLSRASALVRSEAGQAWDDPDTVPDDVKTIVVQAAARVWLNPSAAIQRTAGAFSERLSERAADGLYLTEAEQGILRRYRVTRTGLWTQGVTRNEGAFDSTVYVPTAPPPSGQPFPWYSSESLW